MADFNKTLIFVLVPGVISWASYPMEVNTKTALLLGILIVKFPSGPVVTPAEVPFLTTLTLDIAWPWSSVTLPLTVV